VRAVGALVIVCSAISVTPIAAQRAPQVVFDSALVAEAFAQFALLPYRPLALEERYWNSLGRPGSPIGPESMRVLTKLIPAQPARVEDVLDCPNEFPATVLHPRCSLRNAGALLALSAPEQYGDTVRQKITVVLAGERGVGSRGKVHRILMWFLPSGTEWRAIQREVVWTRPHSP
jgi:hypothetical protein